MDRHTVSLFAGIAAAAAMVGYLGYVGYSTGKSVVTSFTKWKESHPNSAEKLMAFLDDPTKDNLGQILDPNSEASALTT